MKKNLLICLLFVILGVNFAFGDNGLVANTERKSDSNKGFQCATLIDKTNYVAEIVGYDFMNGIVECQIREKNDEYSVYRSENANMHYPKLSFKEYYKKFNGRINFKMESLFPISGEMKNIEYDTTGATITDFLVGLAVLKNIKAEDTKGVTETTSIMNDSGKVEIVKTDESKIAKGINKANIAYFQNLFYNMNTVYIHLQNLLFVVVGGFFLATLGGQKIQKYLENRGQSTGQKEPYLHKFFIPLLCVAVFYMPISGSGGVNSTMIQKIIQYFTTEATAIANRASAIGLQTYATKVRENLGLDEREFQMPNTNVDREFANFMVDRSYNEITTKCAKRYPKGGYIDEETLDWVEMKAKESSSLWKKIANAFGDKYKDIFQPDKAVEVEISTEACKFLVNTYTYYSHIKTSYEKRPQKENNTNLTAGKDSVDSTLTNIEDILVNNEKMYGWIHSAIAPATLLLFEIQKASKVLKAERQKEDGGDIDSITKDLAKKVQQKQKEETDEGIFNELAPHIMSRAAVFLLPGAANMFSLVKDMGFKKDGQLGPTAGFFNNVKIGFIQYFGDAALLSGKNMLDSALQVTDGVGAGIVNTIYNTGKDVLKNFGPLGAAIAAILPEGMSSSSITNIYIAIEFVYTLYMNVILEKFPILLLSMAGMLAFLSYFVTLCKYFYISPFVVAFALTTKRVDKIINFLVTGITIFFKPVLIVMFIYLALFLLTILEDLYLIVASGQFMAIPNPTFDNTNSVDLATPLLKTIFRTILRVLGSLAAIYIVWKTIMTGPDWTFKLLGLDSSGDNTIVRDLSNKMEQKSVQI